MNNNLSANMNLALQQATQTDTSRLGKGLKSIAQGTALQDKGMAEIEEAAEQFEAVFVAEMMKPMFEGIKTEAPFGGGKGEEVFQGLLLQEYGNIVAKTGRIGISDAVKEEMIKMQGEMDRKDIGQ